MICFYCLLAKKSFGCCTMLTVALEVESMFPSYLIGLVLAAMHAFVLKDVECDYSVA